MKKYKVGIIGLGEVAQLMHIPLIKRVTNMYQIKGVYDVSSSLMNYISNTYNVNFFENVYNLISSKDIDIIFVLSPDQYHKEHVLCALENNKHVFVEKPLCLTIPDVDTLIEKQKRGNSCAMVGYMRRFAEPFLLMKKQIDKKQIEYIRVRDIICEGAFFIKQSNHVFYPKDISQSVKNEGQALLNSQLLEACGTKDKSIQNTYQVLTGLSSHSLSALRELVGSPRSVLNMNIHKNGKMIIATLDYGDFYVLYECLIHDVVHFDASIDVFTNLKQYSLTYNTPYVRNLPMTLRVRTSNQRTTQKTEFGPYYSDPFITELKYFHTCISQDKSPKTKLAESKEDFILFKDMIAKI